MGNDDKEKVAEVELKTYNVILKVPENCITLTVTANIVIDGKIETVERDYNQSDIFDARRDFLDNVPGGDDYDAVYVMTDEYREFLENGGTLEEWMAEHP